MAEEQHKSLKDRIQDMSGEEEVIPAEVSTKSNKKS